MTVFERIKTLAKRRSITLKQVTADLGFSENYFYSLKAGKKPTADKLIAIADYFNVSVDYLLGRDEQDTNTDNEIDLSGISQPETEEKIFSYEGKEIPKKDLELIRRILETGEYDE